MSRPRSRCDACGCALPGEGIRCPACGHVQGEPITVELRGPLARRERSGPSATRRWLGVLAVAIAGLAVIAVVTRSGSDSRRAPSPRPPGSSSSSRSSSSGSSVSQADPSSSTASSATPTGVPDIVVPPLALGRTSGVHLLASVDAVTVSIDLDTGRAVTAWSGAAPSAVVPRAGGAVLGTGFDAQLYTAPDAVRSLLGPATSIIASGSPDRVWLVQAGTPTVASEVDLHGSLTAPPLQLPDGARPAGGSAGGLIVTEHGAVYLLRPTAPPQQVAVGDVLAVGSSSILVSSCDADLTCGVNLVGVPGGVARRLAGVPAPDVQTTGVYSLDGRYAAMATFSTDRAAITVVDVELGLPTVVPFATNFTARGYLVPTFSSDGRYVFWPNGASIDFYEIGTPPVARSIDIGTTVTAVFGD